MAGKPDSARPRYARAREAASDAAERALRGERSPSHLTKGQLFERPNAVITASTRALAGRMEPPPAPAPDTSRVTGRVDVDASGATADLVTLGSSPDATGLPSPFVSGPAVAASPGPDGAFALTSVSPGPYRVLAIALSLPRDKADWSPAVSPPSLPVEVRGASVEMPPVRVEFTPPQAPSHTPAANRDATGRSRRGNRTSGGRNGHR